MLNSIYLLILFIGKIIFFILGIIFIILLIFTLYDYILSFFKNKKDKNVDIEKNIAKIELELDIKEEINEWKKFKKYILKLDKEELGNFFYESYEIDNLLFKYNYISLITIRLFSEILVGTNFIGKLEDKNILKIKKIFDKSDTEKDFIDNLKKNKNIWEFIKNNLIFK